MRWLAIALVCSACSFNVRSLPTDPEPEAPASATRDLGSAPDLVQPPDLIPVCVRSCADEDCGFSCSPVESCQCKDTCRDDRCAYVVEANVKAEIRCERGSHCDVTCSAGATCVIECREMSKCECSGAGCDVRK